MARNVPFVVQRGTTRRNPSIPTRKRASCQKRSHHEGEHKRVDVFSETFAGHIHEKTGAMDHGIFPSIPDDVLIHLDLGFLGVPKARPNGTFSLPEKKPKGRPL